MVEFHRMARFHENRAIIAQIVVRHYFLHVCVMYLQIIAINIRNARTRLDVNQ